MKRIFYQANWFMFLLVYGYCGCSDYSEYSVVTPPTIEDTDSFDSRDDDDFDADGVLRWNDCNDSDNTLSVWAVPDADGDGMPVAATEDAPALCVGELPDGYLVRPESGRGVYDCDDSDPEVWSVTCVDVDGDNHCADYAPLEENLCVGEVAPVGYAILADAAGYWAADCDDDDPTVQLNVYADADGDLAWTVEPVGCVPSEEFEENRDWYYLVPGRDCDDGDATFSPNTPDVQGDGEDRNCDDIDDAVLCGDACDVETMAVTCPLDNQCGPFVPTGSSAPCDGVDLALTGAFGIAMCDVGYGGFVLLENLGRNPLNGAVAFTYGWKTWLDEVSEPVPETQVELPVEVLSGEYVVIQVSPEYSALWVELVGDDDCDLSNNYIEFEVQRQTCGLE